MRLLKQESVKRTEWFNLFSDIHHICLWDEESVPRMKEELELNILAFIRTVQDVRFLFDGILNSQKLFILDQKRVFCVMKMTKPCSAPTSTHGQNFSSKPIICHIHSVQWNQI